MSFENGPYLQVAAFCEQVLEDKSGALSLIRLVDRLQITSQGPNAPEQMPESRLNWSLVITIKSGKARGSHPLKIQPVLPSGEALPPMNLSVHLEGENRGQNIVTRLNIPLKMQGVYWFKIYIDDDFVTQVPIEVIYSRIQTPPETH